MTFGAYLRACRLKSQISQRDLAAQVGIDFTYLSKMETGQNAPPSAAVIQRLALALCVEKREMLNHAGHLPKSLKPLVAANPQACELIRLLSETEVTQATYQQLIDIVQAESKGNRG